MKFQNLIINIFALSFLSACSTMINIQSPTVTPIASESETNNLRAAIIITKKQASKQYHIDAKDVQIYPGLTNNLEKHFSSLFAAIETINENKTNDRTYDYLIYPNWEIERRYLTINLTVRNNRTNENLQIEESTWIENRSEFRAFSYLLASLTIIGFPVALKIDNTDISNKIQSAMNVTVMKLKTKLHIELQRNNKTLTSNHARK